MIAMPLASKVPRRKRQLAQFVGLKRLFCQQKRNAPSMACIGPLSTQYLRNIGVSTHPVLAGTRLRSFLRAPGNGAPLDMFRAANTRVC
ncbi:MAG: hypothetical protein JWN98_1466 [Abditibacteriota bacterium]|nr:hypothetical protein [Abditibacteriota bacterium]